MTAANRLAALDKLPANELCTRADEALVELVDIMNRETTLLRAGHLKEAGELTAQKTQLAQDYVTFARTVQREGKRLSVEAPELLDHLRTHHESLATQMAENLRVLATARTVTETILTDVAKTVGKAQKPRTYGASGAMPSSTPSNLSGFSVNRAL